MCRSDTDGGTPGRRSPKRSFGDRFIPNRAAMDLTVSNFELHFDAENPTTDTSPARKAYKKQLARKLFDGQPGGSNSVINFHGKAPKTSHGDEETHRLYVHNRGSPPKKHGRHIPRDPDKILDAPELLDDYYLNLLDWGKKNVLAVALGDSVYLWNAADGGIQQLMQTQGEGDHVTSVAWAQEGCHIAVGTSGRQGGLREVKLWDTERLKLVRTMEGHTGRVSSLAWNSHVLSSGSRDSTIINHDVRIAEHRVGTLKGHHQEVCGLKWSPWGTQLASGGNDNLLNIWDDRYTKAPGGTTGQSLFHLDMHQAAVKALAWCPWQRNLLASGGGTADRMIRFWNSMNGNCLNAVNTMSQVCALQWSQHDKELVSSHGYSHNQLILWKYPSMVRLAELTGHTSRVLQMTQSPDGTTICSAAADETLRFWKILSGGEQKRKESAAAKESVFAMTIR